MGIEVEESVGEDPNRMDRWQQISGEGSEGVECIVVGPGRDPIGPGIAPSSS